jgi:hypothetical protein
MVGDLELTPVSHGSPIYLLRPTLDQPGDGIDNLPMRKHSYILSRMLCKSIQE